MVTGASVLCDALAAFDCELDEIIERYSHALLIGRVVGVQQKHVGDALVYWRGGYQSANGAPKSIRRRRGPPCLPRLRQSVPATTASSSSFDDLFHGGAHAQTSRCPGLLRSALCFAMVVQVSAQDVAGEVRIGYQKSSTLLTILKGRGESSARSSHAV